MGFSGQITRVGSYSLLQGIFLTQESNPDLLHYRQILYHLNHQGSPILVLSFKKWQLFREGSDPSYLNLSSLFFCIWTLFHRVHHNSPLLCQFPLLDIKLHEAGPTSVLITVFSLFLNSIFYIVVLMTIEKWQIRKYNGKDGTLR